MPHSRRWQAVPGWVAAALLILAATLWTFWGMGELYYEGWGQPFPAPLAYLVPAGACLLLTLVALARPAVGGWLFLVGGGGFTAWWWTMAARRGQMTPAGLAATLPVSGVLVLAGALLLLEARHRRRQRAAGESPPRSWLRRRLPYLLAVGLPLLAALGLSAHYLPTVLTRFDDGDYGAREISQSDGPPLIWAPAGPGWGQGSSVAEENWSWNELARYGVPPIGPGDKGIAGDASTAEMEATGLCRYLSADGLALLDVPQDIWRMPTVDEIVRSLVRDGQNAGCTWDRGSDFAKCAVMPDKEMPLWDPQQLAIYYWASWWPDSGTPEAYYVNYSGSAVATQPKGWANPRHGFRCVKEPPGLPHK